MLPVRRVHGADDVPAQVAAERGERPMGLSRQGRVVHEGKDQFGDDVRLDLPAPAAPGTVDEPVDAELVEARDPEAEGALAHPAVAQGDLVGRAGQEEMDGVEAAVGLAIRAA